MAVLCPSYTASVAFTAAMLIPASAALQQPSRIDVMRDASQVPPVVRTDNVHAEVYHPFGIWFLRMLEIRDPETGIYISLKGTFDPITEMLCTTSQSSVVRTGTNRKGVDDAIVFSRFLTDSFKQICAPKSEHPHGAYTVGPVDSLEDSGTALEVTTHWDPDRPIFTETLMIGPSGSSSLITELSRIYNILSGTVCLEEHLGSLNVGGHGDGSLTVFSQRELFCTDMRYETLAHAYHTYGPNYQGS